MPRLTIRLPESLEKELRAAARTAGKSLSAWVVELVSAKKNRRAAEPEGDELALFVRQRRHGQRRTHP
jgi:HicB family